jgi:cell division protein FtsB
MVTRRKLRTLLNTVGLYLGCALVIAYFAINAYTGNHGLRAQQDLDQQYAVLAEELGQLKQERAEWQRRVKLLQSNSIDPDMLDERARAVLNYLDPRDLTLMRKRPQG